MTILHGVDDNPAAFRVHYYDTHIPFAHRMCGSTGCNLSRIEPGSDRPGRCQLVADLDNFVIGTVELLRGDEEEVTIG